MKKLYNYVSKITDIYKINYILSGFYLIQLLLIFILAHSYALPVSTNYITHDQLLSNGYGKNFISYASSHLFDVNIKTIIIIMILISVIFYGLLATIYRYHYEKSMKHRTNTSRWIYSGISYGLIFIVTGLLGGIYDITTLGILFILPIILNLAFLFEERSSDIQPYKQWPWQLIKFVIAILPVAIIFWYVISAIIYGTQGIGTYYYFILATVVLLYLATIINQILQIRQIDKWRKYIYGEQIFMGLEVVLKTAIIWQVFAGVLHP
jgi:hypothetical protein